MILEELPDFYPEPTMQMVLDPIGLDYTISQINDLANHQGKQTGNDGDIYHALMNTLQILMAIQYSARHIKYTRNSSVLLVSQPGTNKSNPFKNYD